MKKPYRLESLCKFVDAVNNAITIHDLVTVHRRVAATAAKHEIDEVPERIRRSCIDRFEKVLRGGLERRAGAQNRVCGRERVHVSGASTYGCGGAY